MKMEKSTIINTGKLVIVNPVAMCHKFIHSDYSALYN